MSFKDKFSGDIIDDRLVDGGSVEKKQSDSGGFAKLFVGCVPKTATEQNVIVEVFNRYNGRDRCIGLNCVTHVTDDLVFVVALLDCECSSAVNIAGNTLVAYAGCCFITYTTSTEAERAIYALHNQYTFRGGVGPIEVKYADRERERLGLVIFFPYGRVEDVYLMRDEQKQCRVFRYWEATAFGGTEFGPGLQTPAIRPPNVGKGMHASVC
ncbi:flowering time control protein FCA isoform X2 [Tanacetum coccineum]